MGNKSPRPHTAKKSGKSLKEKRAAKHAKAATKRQFEIIRPDKHD